MGEQVLQISLIAVRLLYQPETGETSLEFVLLMSEKREFGPDDNLRLNCRDLVWCLLNGLGWTRIGLYPRFGCWHAAFEKRSKSDNEAGWPGSSEGEYGQMASSAWSLDPRRRKGPEGRAPGPCDGRALSQAQPESRWETAKRGGEGGQGQERWDTSRKGQYKAFVRKT